MDLAPLLPAILITAGILAVIVADLLGRGKSPGGPLTIAVGALLLAGWAALSMPTDGRLVMGALKADAFGQELIDELITPYLNEAKAAVAEGIVADAELADAGLIFGTGFAPFRGGPLHYLQSGKATGG